MKYFFNTLKLTALFAVLVSTFACTKQDQSSLRISPSQLNFGVTANEGVFVIQCDEAWEIVTGSNTWCTFSPDKYVAGTTTVTVHVDPLPAGGQSRSGVFTIATSSSMTTLKITQEATYDSNTYFSVNAEEELYTSARNPQPITFSVLTNVSSWTASVISSSTEQADWLTITPTKNSVSVTCTENDHVSQRTATIRVSAGGAYYEDVEITQYGLLDAFAQLPDFELANPGDPASSLKFSQVYRNQNTVTLLYFWGSWCPDCAGFLPYMKMLHEEFDKIGVGIYGVALEETGKEQNYFDYLAANGLNDVGEDGKKLWWENRPIFNPLEQRKVNDFTRQFFGEDMIFVPCIIVVDGMGCVKKAFIGEGEGDARVSYSTRNEADARRLYRQLQSFIEGALMHCNC